MKKLLVTLVAAVPLSAAPLPPRPDLPRMQGTWVVVRQQIGMIQTGGGLGELTLEIKGDIATMTRGAELQSQWMMKFDPLNNPKGMDWVGVGTSKGTVQHGIYRLEDDTFTYCYRADVRP